MSGRAAAHHERTAPASRPIAAGRRPDDVICLSSIDWDFSWQGHQEIMSTLAAEGHRVLFVENSGSSCKGVIGGGVWHILSRANGSHSECRESMAPVGVKKGLSDAAEALRRFADASYRTAIAERAYDLAMSAHTCAHRVAGLVRAVL